VLVLLIIGGIGGAIYVFREKIFGSNSADAAAGSPQATRGVGGTPSYYLEMVRDASAFIQAIGKSWPTKNNNPYAGAQLNRDQFTQDAKNARPIIHEDMVPLLKSWLNHKKSQGTAAEKSVYGNLDIVGLVDRLITKRAVKFINKNDQGFDRSGVKINNNWIGIEKDANRLKDYMSYDELRLSALVTVSSPVQIINTGDRSNKGRLDNNCVNQAIYLGQVGGRFEKSEGGLMEFDHMIDDQYRKIDGTTPFFEQFYWRGHDAGKGTLTAIHKRGFLEDVMLSRYMKMAEIHLAEGQHWGKSRNRDVRISAVGLGLGAWVPKKYIQPARMDLLFVDAYSKMLTHMWSRLGKIKVIEFVWHNFKSAFERNISSFNEMDPNPQQLPNGRIGYKHKASGVMFAFHTQSSADNGHQFLKVPELIVANYAWDSNAFPGNEYWSGQLTASGDPAAACCSTIWNHHNPMINKKYMNGKNCRVLLRSGKFQNLTSC